MQVLKLVPEIYSFDTFQEFSEEFHLNERDLIVTNEWLYNPYVKPLNLKCYVLFQERYGKGEPSDEMIDAIVKDIVQFDFDRIIAFGGGTIVDICKVLALDVPEKSENLFVGKVQIRKVKELIAIPTTCGTGSEVTNVAIAEVKALHTKKGIASENTYADFAVLIPEALQGLPDYVFATSTIDALIHAMESYLSPKASAFTEMYAIKAIEMIINGYRKILAAGGNNIENRIPYLKDFCIAANFAGISFGNAGCAAVHALSYSIGGAFHVPHGEANYQFFIEVFKRYQKKNPGGKIWTLNNRIKELLNCDVNEVYQELEKLLNGFLVKKPLHEYGMKEEQINEFTDMTVKNQQRLLVNNYVEFSTEEIKDIFTVLY